MPKIGLETHISLNKLNSKLFCSCALPQSDSKPNTHTCEICLGMPGSKPVINKKAIDSAIKLALALNCKINSKIRFSRKTYFYPDLSKNFQITQYEIPLAQDGEIILESGKKIRIRRLHLEEDPGALVHPGGMRKSDYVLVDYNRSGIALVEIVTEPDISSPEEAREFLTKLIAIVNYLKIYDPNVSTVKADANVSIEESGFIRTEIKNISGFKEVESALKYEIERQNQAVKTEKIMQETRAWDTEERVTFNLRLKETEDDYGYILEPDLTKIELSNSYIEDIKKKLPELGHQKVKKYIEKYGIKKEDAQALAGELLLAELFEKVAKEIDPILAAKWLRKELIRVLNYNKKEIYELEIDEKYLIELLKLVETSKITDATAKKILDELAVKKFSPLDYVKTHDVEVKSDASELKKLCQEAIKENPKAVEDYKKGEEKAVHFIAGKVMQKTKGRAKPDIVQKILKELLK